MRIDELFDRSYEIHKKNDEDYWFKTDDGRIFEVVAPIDMEPVPNPDKTTTTDKVLTVGFGDIDPRTGGQNFKITGAGDAYRIYATIKKVILARIQQTNPMFIHFSADNHEISKLRLYDRFVEQLQGYELHFKDEVGIFVEYYLKRKDKNITEVKKTSSDNLSKNAIQYRLEQYTEQSENFEDSGTKIQGYDLKSKQGSDALKLVLFDEEGNAIGYLSLLKRNASTYQITTSAVGTQFKRQGIMTALYVAAVEQFNIEIVSDSTWTKGAEMLWKKLIALPNVTVYWRNLEDGEEGDVKKSLPRGFFKDANMRLVLKK